jgi:hypothetical protein
VLVGDALDEALPLVGLRPAAERLAVPADVVAEVKVFASGAARSSTAPLALPPMQRPDGAVSGSV